MYTRNEFLIKFLYLEGELREHLEFSEWKDDKEVRKLLLSYLKEVKEMQAIIRDDIGGLN
jgi:hypothetical protein